MQGSPPALFTGLGPWTGSVRKVTESSHLVGSRATCHRGSLVPNFISAWRPLLTLGQRLPKAPGTKLGHQKMAQGHYPRMAGLPCPAEASESLGSRWTWPWRATEWLGGAHDRDIQRPLGWGLGAAFLCVLSGERRPGLLFRGQCGQVSPRKNFQVKLFCGEGCELSVIVQGQAAWSGCWVACLGVYPRTSEALRKGQRSQSSAQT